MAKKAAQRTIYMNAAGHGLPDESVRRRMARHLQRETEAGVQRAAEEAAEALKGLRASAARLLGAKPEETAFGTATTLAWGQAVAALPLRGTRILVAPHEWVTNIAILQRLDAGPGMTIDVLALDAKGDLDLDALRETLDEDVAAICVPMVSSITGRRYPVEKIGAMARPDHSFFAVDAAQALGQMSVDVKRINCDLLAATARKWLRAPRGTALLYASEKALARMKPIPFPDTELEWHPDRLFFSDGKTAARFEGFDANLLLRLGLAAAIEAAREKKIGAISKQVLELAAHVRKCAEATGLTLFSPAKAQSGITTLRLPAMLARALPEQLAKAGIIVKFPLRRDEPLAPGPPDGDALMRVSPHVYNSPGDIDALFAVIAETARKL